MRPHLFIFLLALIPLTAAFSDAQTNYENKTLIPRFQPFVGFYYYENDSPEKLIYSYFTGPSSEVARISHDEIFDLAKLRPRRGTERIFDT